MDYIILYTLCIFVFVLYCIFYAGAAALFIFIVLYAACAKTPFFFNPIMGATLE